MKLNTINFRYLLLFMPWALAELLADLPQASFLVAWLGSVFILVISTSGYVKARRQDLPFKEQFMRPLFLTQFIFVGYMALTSVFYFMDLLGYRYLEYQSYSLIDYYSLDIAARCQRLYILAHASYTTGLLLLSDSTIKRKWRIDKGLIDSAFFIKATIIFSIATFVFAFVPGLDQFAVKFKDLTYISSILALVYSILEKRTDRIAATGALFAVNFLAAFLSGWKEPIIVTMIVLGGYLYPLYKRVVIALFIPLFFAAIFILPSYNSKFRELAWIEGVNSEQAAQTAIDAIQQGDVDLSSDNWTFLTNRLSEISMFVIYVDRVPSKIDYYGTKIINESFLFLVPRLFWPDKPDVESHVMERVYEIGVVNRNMNVSAKPPIIVDAYLSGGAVVIVFVLLIMGLLTAWIANKCEYLFGGYQLGIAWAFSGLFQILWRGNCMEFLVNSLLWGVITLYMVFYVMRWLKIIEPANS